MSSASYGLNFGFRRSDESLSIREGRFRTPAASGVVLLQGTAVELDPANAGYLKQCAANPAPVTGLRGILVQEEDHLGSIFAAAPLLGHDSLDLGPCKGDKLSVMWSGPGVKVWFKNTPDYLNGSRHKAAVTMLGSLASVNVGTSLGWDGAKWVLADGVTVPKWLTVTQVVAGSDSTTDYVEAVFVF